MHIKNANCIAAFETMCSKTQVYSAISEGNSCAVYNRVYAACGNAPVVAYPLGVRLIDMDIFCTKLFFQLCQVIKWSSVRLVKFLKAKNIGRFFFKHPENIFAGFKIMRPVVQVKQADIVRHQFERGTCSIRMSRTGKMKCKS